MKTHSMAPKPKESKSEKTQPDLASLLDANLGPAWSSSNLPSSRPVKKKPAEQAVQRERKGRRPPSNSPWQENSKTEHKKFSSTRKGNSARPDYPRKPRSEKSFYKICFFPSNETFNAISTNLSKCKKCLCVGFGVSSP